MNSKSHCLVCGGGSGYGFSGGSVVKNPPANAGDTGDAGSTPGSERSPGGGYGNPHQYSRLGQYSCLGNLMDRGAWRATAHGVAKSRTWLRDCVHTCTDGITDGWSFITKNHGCPVFTSKRTKGSATNSEEENALQNVLPCGDPTVKGVYPLCSQLWDILFDSETVDSCLFVFFISNDCLCALPTLYSIHL